MTQAINSTRTQCAATWALSGRALRAMLPTLALVGVIWSVSSWGYYALVNAMALDSGYDDAPLIFASYYLVWTGIVLLAFRPVFGGQLSRPVLSGHAIALAPILIAYGVFVAVALPLLPDVSVFRAPPNPPEFMFASAWYYMPKSVEILFQQVLVAAMVLRAHRARMPLWAISILMAVLFGGFHLTLALEGFSPLYVARFTVAASMFGLVIPWLYLRTSHGFRWAYGLHWGFYALDATVTHLVLAVPKWAM
ncbi:MAG: hypothetical protein NWQ23_03015 [Yoonia sp.]|uniref:type II CAAX prenyl endopeptidase Rce1 family protein n=1 Tax=Yoonia sp. TaxID=2212373 RepID=UPI00273FEE8D|nr:CPBP family glutamic-type intramembrane protease [Yoonia sp.]MDP5084365.1 hypothetical protein [Yoonia sp.]